MPNAMGTPGCLPPMKSAEMAVMIINTIPASNQVALYCRAVRICSTAGLPDDFTVWISIVSKGDLGVKCHENGENGKNYQQDITEDVHFSQ